MIKVSASQGAFAVAAGGLGDPSIELYECNLNAAGRLGGDLGPSPGCGIGVSSGEMTLSMVGGTGPALTVWNAVQTSEMTRRLSIH